MAAAAQQERPRILGRVEVGRWQIFSAVMFPAYLFFTWQVTGLRPEHVVVSILFIVLFWASKRTERFAVLALPFLLVGMLYDNLKLVLGLRGAIHIADLYEAEKAWFGVTTSTGIVTLNEFFRSWHRPWLDLLTGFAYLAYLGEAFLFAVYLFFREMRGLRVFAWAFFIVNLLGMVTYLVYPAAPPWYVELHGFGPANLAALPNPAGAARFDEILGVSVFASFYSRNANVFGAMPSLHCAYPTLVILAAWNKGWRFRTATIAFAVLVWFSAVYLRHHYVLDVVVGVVFAIIGYAASRALWAKVERTATPKEVIAT